MSWNYRLIEHDNGLVSLHEVYYDKAGEPNGCTVDPVSFSGEGDPDMNETATEEVAEMLKAALYACEKPVLKMSMFDEMEKRVTDRAIPGPFTDSRPASDVMKEYWASLVQKKADEARERESVSRETPAPDESTGED